MFFTIIIPVYNVRCYLEECLESVRTQSFSDYEVILIDDGSTDGSETICDEYANTNSNFLVCHQENLGPSVARNVALKMAKGLYIIFLDSDDMLTNNSLEILHKFIIENNFSQIIINRYEKYIDEADCSPCKYHFDKDKFSSLKSYEVFMKLQGLQEFLFVPWQFVVQNEYIQKNNLYFYPGILHEDEEWVPRLILYGGTLKTNDLCLHRYRINRVGSIVRTPNIKRLFDKLLITDILEKNFSSDHFTDEEKQAIKQRNCKLIFGVLCQIDFYKNDTRYDELLYILQQKIFMLAESKKKIHKMAYFIFLIFRLRVCGKILFFITK